MKRGAGSYHKSIHSVLSVGVLDEPTSLASVGLVVLNDRNALHWPKLLCLLTQGLNQFVNTCFILLFKLFCRRSEKREKRVGRRLMDDQSSADLSKW